MTHAVVRFEIRGDDDRSLATFYEGLFGWTVLGKAANRISIDTRGGGINGAIGKSSQPWASFCVETDDPQATLDRAIALGASAVMPVTEVDSTTTMAMFHDLDGLSVGLVRIAAPEQSAAAAPKAPAAPVEWFEIMGSDAARTQQFYATLFGWTIDPSFPDYAVVDTGSSKGIQGGIGGGVDSRWAMVYAGVADVDSALHRAEELGGSRVPAPGVIALKNAARVALYGSADDVGTGVIRDPAGNVFGVYVRHTTGQ
jgi:predicted enzyme related to lactoylglutathione lyase